MSNLFYRVYIFLNPSGLRYAIAQGSSGINRKEEEGSEYFNDLDVFAMRPGNGAYPPLGRL